VKRALYGLLIVGFGACGQQSQVPQVVDDPVEKELAAGTQVDSLGTNVIAEGDTINMDTGLTVIERQVTFPPQVRGEIFAWEFYAKTVGPLKLIVVRFDEDREHFLLVGESQTVVPAQLGANRLALREPIPVRYGDMIGLFQPEEGVVPFKKIHNHKTFITAKPFSRAPLPRSQFSVYGWRYGYRVFYRILQD